MLASKKSSLFLKQLLTEEVLLTVYIGSWTFGLLEGAWMQVSSLRSKNNMGAAFWLFPLLALPLVQSAKILTLTLLGESCSSNC